MQAVRPLVRTAAVLSTSRIPHLECHILRRKISRLHKSQPAPKAVFQCQSRKRSTLAYEPNLASFITPNEPEIDEVSTSSHVTYSTITLDGVPDPDLLAVKANVLPKNVQDILDLQDINPSVVLNTLLNEEIGGPLLRYASDDVFDQAFLKIQPEYLIDPYIKVHRFLNNSIRDEDPEVFQRIENRLEGLYRNLDNIIAKRRDAGFNLSMNTCRHLLKWAGCLGNSALALYAMDLIQSDPNLEPDLACYNYYMQAHIWNRAFTPHERFNLRVLPTNLKFRSQGRKVGPFSGHSVHNAQSGIEGIRQKGLGTFKRLVEQGLQADEFTFVNLMTAMGREGDVVGVKSILKSVWNVDVDMLLRYDEDELESPTFYEEDSPLRPSGNLLSSMVHIFGSNNDAPTAWLLVDYISRNYNLQIPTTVWQELLEWYLILSIPRSKTAKHIEQKAGYIIPETFRQLFSIMQDQPHQIEPNGVMYYFSARSERGRNNLGPQLLAMRNLLKSIQKSQEDITDMATTLRLKANARSDAIQESEFVAIRDQFYLSITERETMARLLTKMLFRTFNNTKYARPYHPTRDQWERQIIPDIIAEFAEHMPNEIHYRTATGVVDMNLREHRQKVRRQLYGENPPWKDQFYSSAHAYSLDITGNDPQSGQSFTPFFTRSNRHDSKHSPSRKKQRG